MRIVEDQIPLAPEDRAILALECRTIAGHTCKVVRLGTPALALERLRADHAGLLALVAQLFEQRLDRARPLWRMDTVALQDGGSAIIWRVHHSLADGTACVRYGRTLLWDEGPETAMTPAQTIAAHAADEARRRAHLIGFLRREYVCARVGSPFDGEIGTRREVALATVSLPDLHRAAKALDGATVNDAVLTIVAGAVGRWVRLRHGDLGTIRVRVPVSLHHEGDAVANHDSFFSVEQLLRELSGERHALRVSAVSLAGLLCFGLCADPDLVDRLPVMAEGIEAEAGDLLSAAGVTEQPPDDYGRAAA